MQLYDDPDLDLDDTRRADLARQLEDAAGTLAAVRYGSRLRLAAASVVLNPDSPLVSGALATGIDGNPAAVEAALHALPAVFAEAGRNRVVLSASPSSAPELELLAEESGYEAVEETTALLLTRPVLLVEGEPGRITLPLRERDEHLAAPLVAEAHGWSRPVERRLQRLLGHRFDDPRHVTLAAHERGELVGVAAGFLHAGLGQVVDVAVRPGCRGRGTGRALASGVATVLLGRGADAVWLQVEAGGTLERACTSIGFAPAYEAVTYVLPLE